MHNRTELLTPEELNAYAENTDDLVLRRHQKLPSWLTDIAIDVHRLASDESIRQRFIDQTSQLCDAAQNKHDKKRVILFSCEPRPWRLCFCYGLLAAIHDILRNKWESKVLGDAWLFEPDYFVPEGPENEPERLTDNCCRQLTLRWEIGKLRDSYKPDIEEILDTVRKDLASETDITPDDAPATQEAETPSATEPTLKPSESKAYGQYKQAIQCAAELEGARDRDVYNWVTENLIDDGEKLPAFATWQRQLRAARQYHGAQKNTPKHGRPTRKSIVSANEI